MGGASSLSHGHGRGKEAHRVLACDDGERRSVGVRRQEGTRPGWRCFLVDLALATSTTSLSCLLRPLWSNVCVVKVRVRRADLQSVEATEDASGDRLMMMVPVASSSPPSSPRLCVVVEEASRSSPSSMTMPETQA